MSSHLDDLHSRASALSSEADSLREQLRQAADVLETSGVAPADDLISALRHYREGLHSLAKAMPQQARGKGSLESLRQAIADLRSFAKPREILNSLLRLQHRTEPTFEPLFKVQNRCQVLLERFANADQTVLDEAQQIEQGTHPLVALLSMVQEGDSLSDDQWSHAHQLVEKHFDSALAVAAARGHLCFPQQTDACSPREDQEAIPKPPPESFRPDHSTYHSDDASSWSSTTGETPGSQDAFLAEADTLDSASIFNEERPLSGNQEKRLSPVIHKRSSSEESQIGQPLPRTTSWADVDHAAEPPESFPLDSKSEEFPSDTGTQGRASENGNDIGWPASLVHDEFEAPDHEIVELVNSAWGASTDDEPEILNELAWQIIDTQEASLAWHLQKAREDAAEENITPPSRLIKLYVLGKSIPIPGSRTASEIENLIRDELADPPSLGEDTNDKALWLLQQAGLLLPAVLAPSTGAASLMRSQAGLPEFSQLYNFFRHVGTYAENSEGIPIHTIRRETSPEWEQQYQALRRDVRRWITETPLWAVSISPTEPLYVRAHWTVCEDRNQRKPSDVSLFAKWMRVINIADNLVGPVLEDRRDERSQVEALVARVMTHIRCGRDEDYPRGAELIILPDPIMERYLREAAEYARRWLNLCASHDISDTEIVLSESATKLLREIMERLPGALEEAEIMRTHAETSSIKIAANGLWQTLKTLGDLISPESALDLSHATPQGLLSSELLRRVDCQLDGDWMPMASPSKTVNLILQAVSSPIPSWTTAFYRHWKSGHHDEMRRLLSLPVWKPHEHDTLLEFCHQNAEQIRSRLSHELQAIQAVLDDLSSNDLPMCERHAIDSLMRNAQVSISSRDRFLRGEEHLNEVRQCLKTHGIVVDSIPVEASSLPVDEEVEQHEAATSDHIWDF